MQPGVKPVVQPIPVQGKVTSKPMLTAAVPPLPIISMSRRKRRVAPDEPGSLQELKELREWKKRVDEKEKRLHMLVAASSSCIVCMDTRPDLVSYGACGHMVCVSCALYHVSNTLLVLRRPYQNTGCKARMARYALMVEDAEFSCPMCRQGQLDLMGAGLALLPDFVYYQLASFCFVTNDAAMTKIATSKHSIPLLVDGKKDSSDQRLLSMAAAPPTPPPPPPSKQIPAIVQNSTLISSPAIGMSAAVGIMGAATALTSLTSARKSAVLAQIEQNRQSATAALQSQLAQRSHATNMTGKDECCGLECTYCGIRAAAPGETGKDKMLPSEVLRHVWKCRKRSFVCAFPDCKKTFTWESVFATDAPKTVGKGGDFQIEAKWLALLNAAFAKHMQTDCIHKTQCCLEWCEHYSGSARIPLFQYHIHESLHKAHAQRFQSIGKLIDSAARIEKTMKRVLRTEFKRMHGTMTTPDTGAATLVSVATISGPCVIDAKHLTDSKSGDATTTSNGGGGGGGYGGGGADVMSFAEPIARQAQETLTTLNDILNNCIDTTDTYVPSRGLVIRATQICPFHGEINPAGTTTTTTVPASGEAHRPRASRGRSGSSDSWLGDVDEIDLGTSDTDGEDDVDYVPDEVDEYHSEDEQQ